MKLDTVWSGRLPKYWDVTPWTALVSNHVISCYRDQISNRRMLEVFDITSSEKSTSETLYSSIIGHIDHIVYLARIADARSHLQINRMGAYDILKSKFIWEINETFLVEKFRIPDINVFTEEQYVLGNKQVNLLTGIISDVEIWTKNMWVIDSEISLVQNSKQLECIDRSGRIIWVKEGFFGNQYQGVKGQEIFFLMDDLIIYIDKWTGVQQDIVGLSGMRIITNRILGQFDRRNDLSYDNSTVADVLINDSFLAWINEEGSIVIKDRSTEKIITKDFMGQNHYLAGINHNYLLIFDIQEEDYGNLIVADLGV